MSAKATKPKKPKKPKKLKMQAWILSREDLAQPGGYVVLGAYQTLQDAETARDTKINTYVANQNALRDTAYAAGEDFQALLTYADVIQYARITEVTVGA